MISGFGVENLDLSAGTELWYEMETTRMIV